MKRKLMFIVGVLLGILCLGTSTFAFAFNDQTINIKEIQINENLKRVEIRKSDNRSLRSANTKQEIIGQYQLNESSFSQSDYIIIQEEKVYPIRNPDGNEPQPLSSWTDSEEYLTITTTVYRQGQSASGNPVFEVQGSIQAHKHFKINKTDYMVIRHDNNAVYNDSYESKKVASVKYMRDSWEPYETRDVNGESANMFGTSYAFKNRVPSPDLGIFSYFYLRSVYGKHYLTATNDTAVQVAYVHDEKFFGSISLSFKNLGVSFDIKGATIFAASPVSISYVG